MIEISLNEDQKKDFQKNGFLIIESFLNTIHLSDYMRGFIIYLMETLKQVLNLTSGIGSLKVDPKMLLDKFVTLGNQIIL